ncbi:MAG: hypothetical protein QGH39_06690 [Candidatus Thermoplasmatota archaeon]|nr:hypothetical protein [Candidatus Thermoplasmatota archaeon]
MNRQNRLQYTAALICLGMILSYIPAALAVINDNDIPIGTIKEEGDWWMHRTSNYTNASPKIDGNLSDWNQSHFMNHELYGDDMAEIEFAMNNNQTELYFAWKGKNMTLPPGNTRNGEEDGPAWDMFIFAFDTDDGHFGSGDQAFYFSAYWNESGALNLTGIDTFLDGDLYGDREDDGPGFNMSGDLQQDGNLTLNFTGNKVINASGDYIIEISFPLDSGDVKDFSLHELYRWGYGFNFTMMMFDINNNSGFGMEEMWVDLSYLDTDGDGYADIWEDDLGTDKNNIADFPLDNDNDGMPDTYDDDDDDDGYSDADEIAAGSNPMDDTDIPPDLDGDSIPDIFDEDIDGDGFSNWDEQVAGTDELDPTSHPPIVVPDLINNGLAWLTGQQRMDGSWDGSPGITSLCLLAYLNNNINEGNATVDAAISYLIDEINLNWDENNPPINQDATYSASMAILALKATMNPDYDVGINALGDWLNQTQLDEDNLWGGTDDSNQVYGGWGYGHDDPNWADLSNTQWALMGLDAWGNLSKNDGLWTRALVFLENCQSNITGGFTYMPMDMAGPKQRGPGGPGPMDPSYGSMSAAGLWSLMLCGLNDVDPRVQAAIGWFERNYTWKENAHQGDQWLMYYYITLAKALTMVGMEFINVVNGTFVSDGPHNWTYNMTENLTAMKKLNHSYWEESSNGPVLATAYAILCLETQTLPEGANLSAVFTLHSNATLHIYDDGGRHIGLVLDTDKVEVGIPGATLSYKGHAYSYSSSLQDIVEGGVGDEQIILPLAKAGKYTIELVGISTGSYELEIEGYIGEEEASSAAYSGEITLGEVHSTDIVVTAMEGPLTIFSQDPEEIPTLSISPAAVVGDAEPGDVISRELTFTETSSIGPVDSIVITAFDLVSQNGLVTIPVANISIDSSSFDLAAGATKDVTVNVTISESQTHHLYTGRIKVESSLGTKYIPVNLVVSSVTYNFALTSPDNTNVIEPGKTASYSLIVNNQADGPDVIDLEISKPSFWTVVLSQESLSLAAGGMDMILVNITAPENATDGSIGNVTITGTSLNLDTLVKTLTFTTTVNIPPPPALQLTLGPFKDVDGVVLSGATIKIIVGVDDYDATGTSNAGGNITFEIPASWAGMNVTVHFSLTGYNNASGTLSDLKTMLMDPANLTGWVAPAKIIVQPKTITLTLGPFKDTDGNVIPEASITIIIEDYTDMKKTNASGFVVFSIPAELKEKPVTVKFDHPDYEKVEGKINKLSQNSTTIDPNELDNWSLPVMNLAFSPILWIIGAIITVIVIVVIIFVIVGQKKKEEPISILDEEDGLDSFEDEEEEGWDEEEPSDNDEGWDDEEDEGGWDDGEARKKEDNRNYDKEDHSDEEYDDYDDEEYDNEEYDDGDYDDQDYDDEEEDEFYD